MTRGTLPQWDTSDVFVNDALVTRLLDPRDVTNGVSVRRQRVSAIGRTDPESGRGELLLQEREGSGFVD